MFTVRGLDWTEFKGTLTVHFVFWGKTEAVVKVLRTFQRYNDAIDAHLADQKRRELERKHNVWFRRWWRRTRNILRKGATE